MARNDAHSAATIAIPPGAIALFELAGLRTKRAEPFAPAAPTVRDLASRKRNLPARTSGCELDAALGEATPMAARAWLCGIKHAIFAHAMRPDEPSREPSATSLTRTDKKRGAELSILACRGFTSLAILSPSPDGDNQTKTCLAKVLARLNMG